MVDEPSRAAAQTPPEDEHTTGRALLISVVAAIGGFLFGFDTAVINGAVDAIREEFDLSSFALGFTVAIALLGSAVGAWFAGAAADRWGRVRVMVIAAGLFAAGAIGSGLATAAWDLALWRFVGGVGVGVASVIAPAYIAEIAPAHLRGRLGSLQQLAIVTGIFVALLSDAFLARLAGGADQELWFGLPAWRWMFLTMLVPALAYGVLALQIPESPRWLVARGDDDTARQVLRQVLGSARVDTKIREIQDSLNREHRPRMSDIRGRNLGLLPIVWVGILLSVFQQFVGINVIFYYSTTLWRSVGFTEESALTITVITSVTNVVVTLVAISLIDKIGRKPLLLIGSAGMAVTLGLMAICFTQATGSGDTLSLPDPWGTIALVAANLYVVFFGVSWGPVVWVLLGEMFSNQIRAAALAVAAAAQWLANFLISTTFPALASIGLSFAYGLYTAFAVLSFVFVMRYVHETKGRELEHMDNAVGRARRAPAPATRPPGRT
ncbi:sugar porter family MFS transporter [Geodermatophilus ruber]|uniref:MFS transporter, sugar porter (SP) family n=1 Tax=Geodermatophilus ruber TaxID=504800 RepID=A0A1I4A8K8_9ACTN|nr:sugar porter family MFS transporter [Geodermatophilus ruber]SFK52520.1 MFS transporter, sugar porter (SP) family [Geodermatophilus ruber]